MPQGAAINVSDMVGKANIGDTMGPLRFEASATQSKIGKVSSAKISLAGTGRLNGDVKVGRLTVEDGASLNGNVTMSGG